MNLKPDEVRLVALTNQEILTIILYLRKVVPTKDEENIIYSAVTKLQKTMSP